MRLTGFIKILAASLPILCFSAGASAQFKDDAFRQSYNDDDTSTEMKDSTDQLFSIKEWAGGLAHKNELKIGTAFAPSIILPGTMQIYNRDYWKLPLVYGTIGGFATAGGVMRHRYNASQKAYDAWKEAGDMSIPEPGIDTRSKTISTWMFVGAGVSAWAWLLDGVISYESDQKPLPGRATLYSLLLPGLGQIYNGELWKVPLYQGLIIGGAHFLYTNNLNYQRFRKIYIDSASTEVQYTGPIAGETAKYYRDVYRRYRDYSILFTAAFYLLNVIDANVFAYMNDFEVTDDISMKLEPAVLLPDNAYAVNPYWQDPTQAAIGLRLGIKF